MTIFLLLHHPHKTQTIPGDAQQWEEEEAHETCEAAFVVQPGSSHFPTPVALSPRHNSGGEGELLALRASRSRALLHTVQCVVEPSATTKHLATALPTRVPAKAPLLGVLCHSSPHSRQAAVVIV